MRVAPQTVERIKSQFRLSEVIGRHVTLRRAGREFMGLCPFHSEKTPSFTVNDEKGFFHCFGCGAHGDVIGFIKDIERLEYKEAIERLATEAGIELPKYEPKSAEQEAQMERQAQLYQVLERACVWFERQLQGSIAVEARDYVRERGLTGETLSRFRIGYAPNDRTQLKAAMMKEGISEQLLIDTGLLIKPDSGQSYDRFRGRLMFPIRDIKNRVIAFGGRILPQFAQSSTGQTIAKYLNSPETELFHKSEVLYGLSDARKHIYDLQKVVITEGYMDAIALHQAGFHYAVAPLGTSVTESHLKLLWKHANEPIFCLDGDQAGQKAMLRVADFALPLLQSGKGLRFALLPKGEDPDSLIRAQGAQAMNQLLAKSLSLSEILWESQRQSIGQETPERMAQLETKLMQVCERIVDRTLRSHFRSYFRRRLWVKGMPPSSMRNTTEGRSRLAHFAAVSEQQGLKHIEREIMTLLVAAPELLQKAEIEESVARMDFTLSGLEPLRQMLLALFHEIQSLDTTQARAALALRGMGDQIEELLASSINKLPNMLAADPWRAAQFWEQFHTIYIAEKSVEEQRHLGSSAEDAETLMKMTQMVEESKRSRAKRDYLNRELETTEA